MSASLTKEQEDFLKECETEFSNRYTNEDPDYKKVYDVGTPAPPIICPWYGRNRFGDNNFKSRRHNTSGDHQRMYNSNRDHQDFSRDNRYERQKRYREDDDSRSYNKYPNTGSGSSRRY